MSSHDILLTRLRFAYVEDDSLVQQTLFLSSHDKVVRVVPVVNNVLQVDACNDDNAGVSMLKRSKVVQNKMTPKPFLKKKKLLSCILK